MGAGAGWRSGAESRAGAGGELMSTTPVLPVADDELGCLRLNVSRHKHAPAAYAIAASVSFSIC